MTGDFARRLAALGIDRRALLSYLHRVGPLPARELAIAAHLPLGMVLALLPELRRAGFVTWRAGCWRLSHAAELHAADTRPQDRAEPEPMPAHHPTGENAATAGLVASPPHSRNAALPHRKVRGSSMANQPHGALASATHAWCQGWRLG